MINALTIDVEDWYQTNGLDLPADTWSRYEDRVEESTMKVLRLLDRYQVKATFFVLGCVAQAHPDLVREIARRGHEIGSHGGWHQLLTRLTPEQFRDDLKFSKRVLEPLSGRAVAMYRAPSWSMGPDRYGLLRILQQEGFAVDSSLQPFSTPLSGVPGGPTHPFYPMLGTERLNLVEFPSTVLNLGGPRLPFSGGFYLRAMPYPVLEWALRRVNRRGPGMIYLHPWEFDPQPPRVDEPLSPLVKLAQYYKLHTTEAKLEKLLQRFRFMPLGRVIQEHGAEYPVVSLA